MPRIDSPGIPQPSTNGAAGTTDPAMIHPFTHHGIDVTFRPGYKEAVGQCPICKREESFSLNVHTGQWQCIKGKCWSGNKESLLSQIWERSLSIENAPDNLAERLVKERGLLSISTLSRWGVRWSSFIPEIIVPGFSASGKIVDLYRYAFDPGPKKYRWISTPGYHHGLWGVPLFSPEKERTTYCEGIWDGMILWEIVGETENVLATPSANVFKEEWGQLTPKKTVCLMYDNDWPKENPTTKQQIEPTGFAGMKRAAGVLKGLNVSQQPKEIKYLWWGEEGYSKDHKSGYDVRDHITASDTIEERKERVNELSASLTAVPSVWPAIKHGNEELTPLKCESWKELQAAFMDALEWSNGLDKSLTVMLASVISTMMVSDCPLWVRLIGPASSAKTTLCEALAVSKWIESRDHFTGLHSAYKAGKNDTTDHSLLPKLMDKTFIIKEADTFMKSANRDVLLSELRAAYDGSARVFFKTGIDRSSTNFRFTVIMAGTGSMREYDSAELGSRFVDVIILDKMEQAWERKVQRKIVLTSIRNLGLMANGSAATSQDTFKVIAKRKCGGYVNYLRENAAEILGKVQMTLEDGETVIDCAEFVAFMRARPAKKQTEVTEREFSGRLVEQYMKLAQCLAAVMGKEKVDAEILKRVKEVAIDTSVGTTLDMVHYLYRKGCEGVDTETMRIAMHQPEDTLNNYLRFLRKIEVVESIRATSRKWYGTRQHWRLTARVSNLYERVTGAI